MSGAMSAWQVMAEWRRVMVPLAVLVLLNVLAYLVVVYPLSQRVANVEERNRAAELGLEAARAEYNAAEGTVTGKDRASAELATFYRDVLPTSLAGARRLTYPRLEQMAEAAGLSSQNYRFETIDLRDSSLTRAMVKMALTGDYDGMRAFLHALESAPEFVVIDDVALAEGTQATGDLALTIQLSTYFRADGP